jgi:hypothetical protein
MRCSCQDKFFKLPNNPTRSSAINRSIYLFSSIVHQTSTFSKETMWITHFRHFSVYPQLYRHLIHISCVVDKFETQDPVLCG